MMENVPALMDDVRLRRVRRSLAGMGYRCEARVFDATKYGVPQRRRRMILLGTQLGSPRFAEPINRERTVQGAIRRMPRPEASRDSVHNYAVKRSDRVMRRIRRVPKDGGSRGDLGRKEQLKCHRRCNGFKDVYGRMAWVKPAPTITGGWY